MSLPIFGDKSVGAGGLWLSPLSYNFAQQSGWSFTRSGVPRAKLQATWWQNARAARSSLPTLPERDARAF